MKDRKIKSLFSTEEWILLNLKNAKYQVSFYLKQLSRIKDKVETNEDEEKFQWYLSVFNYYQNDLIPALLESADMEERHLAILEKNPDHEFEPMKAEVEYHQSLNKLFFNRFEEIHKEFYNFTRKF